MKNSRKLVLISLSIFVLSTIAMSCLYFLLHRFAAVYNFKYITTVITQIGLIGGFIGAITFLIIFYLTKKVKNIWLLSFLFIVLIIFLIFLVYCFFVTIIFYDIDGSKSFLGSLMEMFEL